MVMKLKNALIVLAVMFAIGIPEFYYIGTSLPEGRALPQNKSCDELAWHMLNPETTELYRISAEEEYEKRCM